MSSLKMANLLDKFFVHVSQKINDEIPRTPQSPLHYLRHHYDRSVFISLSSANEIEILTNSFKVGKFVGPYSIPVKLLKILCSYTICNAYLYFKKNNKRYDI